MFSRHNTPEIGVDELEDLMRAGSVHLLDVREDWEYRRGRVPGAVSVPMGRLGAQFPTLPRDKPYAVICQSGSRSRSAQSILLQQRLTDVRNVLGGTSAWRRAGLPIQ